MWGASLQQEQASKSVSNQSTELLHQYVVYQLPILIEIAYQIPSYVAVV
jgi:hypothetical protein